MSDIPDCTVLAVCPDKLYSSYCIQPLDSVDAGIKPWLKVKGDLTVMQSWRQISRKYINTGNCQAIHFFISTKLIMAWLKSVLERLKSKLHSRVQLLKWSYISYGYLWFMIILKWNQVMRHLRIPLGFSRCRYQHIEVETNAFSNAFSWMKLYDLRLIFHCNLSPKVKLTIFHHWFN